MKHRCPLLALTWAISFVACAEPLALATAPLCDLGRTAATGGARLGNVAFAAVFDADDWTGSLQAFSLDSRNGTLAGTPTWDSADTLDQASFRPATRTVLSHDGASGIALRWEQLGAEQKTRLAGADGEALGRLRLDFIRGEHGGETSQGGPLRARLDKAGQPFRQGAIVNSRPWPVAGPATRFPYEGFRAFRTAGGVADRPSMVWVGGNDGMLHGFDARDGAERLAYVPRGIFALLRAFTLPGWQQRYLVDGSAFAGDADIGAGDWATVLVGSPGAGAKGYFALDVSRPRDFAETTAGTTVLLDTTATDDPDIGHITGEPSSDFHGASQIVRLNNQRWAVLLGNGANSGREMPVLLLQYLDRARELARIEPACPRAPAGCAWRGGNGLGPPTPIDLDADGQADIAYAGDLHGNLWKFDLSDADASHWKVGFGGKPLFTARDATGRRQPIVAAPAWLPHPAGGVMLALGTGRNLGTEDCADTHVQTLYGLHDNSTVTLSEKDGKTRMTLQDGTPIDTPADAHRPDSLVAQAQLPAAIESDGQTYYRTTANTGPPGGPARRGWFFDLPAAGERLLRQPQVFAGQKMLFHCSAPGQDYLTVLNLITGQPSATPVFSALASLAQTPGSAVSAGQARSSTRIALAPGSIVAPGLGKELLLVSPGRRPVRLDKGRPAGLRAGWKQLR